MKLAKLVRAYSLCVRLLKNSFKLLSYYRTGAIVLKKKCEKYFTRKDPTVLSEVRRNDGIDDMGSSLESGAR